MICSAPCLGVPDHVHRSTESSRLCSPSPSNQSIATQLGARGRSSRRQEQQQARRVIRATLAKNRAPPCTSVWSSRGGVPTGADIVGECASSVIHRSLVLCTCSGPVCRCVSDMNRHLLNFCILRYHIFVAATATNILLLHHSSYFSCLKTEGCAPLFACTDTHRIKNIDIY
jgi:hypothetical protein